MGAVCWGHAPVVIHMNTWPPASPPISPLPCPPPPLTLGLSPALDPERAAQTVAPAVLEVGHGDLQTLKVSPIILHQECHNPRLCLVSGNIFSLNLEIIFEIFTHNFDFSSASTF